MATNTTTDLQYQAQLQTQAAAIVSARAAIVTAQATLIAAEKTFAATTLAYNVFKENVNLAAHAAAVTNVRKSG
jgi:hypothetical protein